MINFIREIRLHIHAFKALVEVNIKTSVLSTRLGWLWWILDPLFLMAVYYFLIKGVFNRGGENFHVFVLCGIVSWQFFARALTESIGAISGNKQIIQQIAFPLPVLVAVPIITRFFFAIIGVFIVMLFNMSVVSVNTLAVFPLFILIGMLSFGLGLFASVINMYFGDIKQFTTYILRAGFFCTPILYPASRLLDSSTVPDTVKLLLQLNPMMWLIGAVREVLIDGQLYSWAEFGVLALLILITIQLGLLWLRASSSKIVKML